ncbi:DUF4326 domain-containing protein, partial [Mesorhizobium mediterraneum]|uniref:DUF4326 domain-containing protein n=1 Tax=Mesorhizobium mediterraneum TaxID=43617 RepID=UPI0032B81F42
MCRVRNKHHAGVPRGAVYIGRGSKWGNPFRIGANGDRAAVIAKHECWLADQRDLLRALSSYSDAIPSASARRCRATAICCCGSPTRRA